MKTAISIPDDVFAEADRTAERLGVSRSELYTNAVREYVANYRRDNITDKLNKLYARDQSASQLNAVLGFVQTQSLERDDW